VSDLSISGAFIQTDLAPATLSHIDIVFDGSQRGASLREDCAVLRAHVVRNEQDGIGVE
jgi:hypothetical protein